MIRIGIIGCGKIAQVRHAPEYMNNPDCKIVALYDTAPQRAQEMAQKTGAAVYGSIGELLSSGVDAVSVCVHNVAHATVSIQALRSGAHVLCEKPMATTLPDCEEMSQAARETGRILMIGHNQRYSATHQRARGLIREGAIGKPLAFRLTFCHPGPEGWTGLAHSWFFNKDQAAFGTLADLGVHKVDLLHFLLGDRVSEVSCRTETLHKTDAQGQPVGVDDNAFCLLKTRGGAAGTLHVSWTNYGREDNSTRIYGTKGVLKLFENPEHALVLERQDGEILRQNPDHMPTNEEQQAGILQNTGVIDAFIRSVKTGAPTESDAWEALGAMRVLFAAAESARTGRTVEVAHRA